MIDNQAYEVVVENNKKRSRDADELLEIEHKRSKLNKKMDKNAQMMIKKHDHKRNKTTREFILLQNVSVAIPRIDRSGCDLKRIPGKKIKISGEKTKFHEILTVWGILNDKYQTSALEPFAGIVDVDINKLSTYNKIGLTEAAKLQNANNCF